MKPQVLYVGNEPSLSKASCELLRSVGYESRACLPRNVAMLLKNVRANVVVLCATINGQESDEIVEAVAELQPGIPVISVHVGLLGDSPHPGSSAIVDALAGPNALLFAVKSVLQLKASAG
jgi:uncharacterized protein with ACT and thioredoxin-like domain